MIRASGPLLDRAFATGTLTAAVTALGTYAAAGRRRGRVVLLGSPRAAPGIPTRRAVLVGARACSPCRASSAQALDGDGAVRGSGCVTVAVAVAVLTLAVAFVAGRPAGGRQAAIGLTLGCGLSVGLQLVARHVGRVWRDGWSGWVVAVVIALAPSADRPLAVRRAAARSRDRAARAGCGRSGRSSRSPR